MGREKGVQLVQRGETLVGSTHGVRVGSMAVIAIHAVVWMAFRDGGSLSLYVRRIGKGGSDD